MNRHSEISLRLPRCAPGSIRRGSCGKNRARIRDRQDKLETAVAIDAPNGNCAVDCRADEHPPDVAAASLHTKCMIIDPRRRRQRDIAPRRPSSEPNDSLGSQSISARCGPFYCQPLCRLPSIRRSLKSDFRPPILAVNNRLSFGEEFAAATCLAAPPDRRYFHAVQY